MISLVKSINQKLGVLEENRIFVQAVCMYSRFKKKNMIEFAAISHAHMKKRLWRQSKHLVA